ncbi:MAG: hypothetical protein R3A52_21390 [Polyangiales bacterium]
MRLAGLALTALAFTTVGCRWIDRRRHRGRARATVTDPRRLIATGCPDPRFVTGQRVVVTLGDVGHARRPAVATVGPRRVVAWATDDDLRVAFDGAAQPTRLAAPGITDGPAVASTAASLTLAWTDRAGAHVVSVTPDGAASRPVDLDPAASHPALTSTPRGVFVAAVSAGRLTLWRVAEGAATPIPSPITEPVASPSIASTGGRLALAWRGGTDARGTARVALLGLDGALSAGPGTVADPGTPVGAVSVVWGRARGLVAWSDARSGAMGLHVATFDGAARVRSHHTRLSIRWPDDGAASLTWDGGAFNVAWWEPVGGARPRAYLALIDPSGARMGSAMRVWTDDTVGLRDASLGWASPDHLLVAATEEGGVELRATGPRGCDMPL